MRSGFSAPSGRSPSTTQLIALAGKIEILRSFGGSDREPGGSEEATAIDAGAAAEEECIGTLLVIMVKASIERSIVPGTSLSLVVFSLSRKI
jgi:hypothetical protein